MSCTPFFLTSQLILSSLIPVLSKSTCFASGKVLELLTGLVKVSSSVARSYSMSHLSEMRFTGGGGGYANYDDLSILSAQFHAAVSPVYLCFWDA